MAVKQNEVAMQALETGSRPLLRVGFSGIKTPVVGERLGVGVLVTNLGKTPAKANIRSVAFYSLKKADAPALTKDGEIQLVWPGDNTTVPSEGVSLEPMTSGQIKDLEAGEGFFYAMARVTYGNYVTSVCTEYKLKIDPSNNNRFIWHSTGLCADPNSNEAN
jgi:hypothetical protein